jgi:hypothetical protein
MPLPPPWRGPLRPQGRAAGDGSLTQKQVSWPLIKEEEAEIFALCFPFIFLSYVENLLRQAICRLIIYYFCHLPGV